MKRFEIDLLESFVRVAEAPSLTEAARALFVAQPTLTSRVHALERELGVELFQRGGGRLRLSPAGEYLLPLAREALATLDRIRGAAQEYQMGAVAPPILIASSMTLSRCFLPRCLRLFLGRYPMLRVSVVSVHGSEVAGLLRAGSVHLGMMHQPREFYPADLVQSTLYASPMVPVARPGHHLTGRRVGLADVCACPLITFCEDSGYWSILANWFRRRSLWPRACIRLNHIPTMQEMVLQGAGVSFLPADTVEDDLRVGRLARVEVGERLPRSFVRLMYSAGRPATPATDQLVACIETQAGFVSRHRLRPAACLNRSATP